MNVFRLSNNPLENILRAGQTKIRIEEVSLEQVETFFRVFVRHSHSAGNKKIIDMVEGRDFTVKADCPDSSVRTEHRISNPMAVCSNHTRDANEEGI